MLILMFLYQYFLFATSTIYTHHNNLLILYLGFAQQTLNSIKNLPFFISDKLNNFSKKSFKRDLNLLLRFNTKKAVLITH